MKLVLGGYAGSGKSTLFRALTGLERGATHAGPAVGILKVPDPRLEKLVPLYGAARVVPVEIEIVDLPGLPPAGEKPGWVLAGYREAGLLILVAAAFVVSVDEAGDLLADELCRFDAELLAVDLTQIDKRLDRLRKEGKAGGAEAALLHQVAAGLAAGRPLRAAGGDPQLARRLAVFQFLSQVPLLAVLNVAEPELGAAVPAAVRDVAAAHAAGVQVVCAAIEAELVQLAADERRAFAAELGVVELAADRLVGAAYERLDCISFITAGEKEVRAWSLRRGETAYEAAGKVHTDMQRGFIRAEVASVEDLVAQGGEAGCRRVGALRVEGKDYAVQDGDVIKFRFAV